MAALTYTCLLQHDSLLQEHTEPIAFPGNSMLLHKFGYVKQFRHSSPVVKVVPFGQACTINYVAASEQ